MNSLKFRAWNKKSKYMDLIDGYDLYLVNNNVYEVYSGTCCYETTLEKVNVTDNYEVMQWTGLYDYRGKEIYEGDIIRYNTHSCYLLDSLIAEVKYLMDRACFCYVTEANGSMRFHPFSQHDELQTDFLNYVEVIGNIYENPELLKS